MTGNQILLGGSDTGQVLLDAGMANRHGLITGATGTGKTVTLQVLAESFSRLGVPVFTADVKGDLSGLAGAGKPHPKVAERIERIGIDGHAFEACPTVFWDVYGEKGHPVRTTISEMGPTLLSNLLELNETQEGVMQVAFSVADDEGLLLLDIKDLRAMLNWVADNTKDLERIYGRVSSASVTAILRRLLVLEEAGGDRFFGEPAIRIEHLMQTDFSGRGVISILDATTLYHSPRIYATFLLWLLSELMEELPERGDADRPRLVFFFDEAHLLFDKAPRALLQRITQVVRLIRSKGVGVFFVSQYPDDVPDEVIGQLGNRVQHALRAFTPRDRKAVRAAAETFRENPAFDTAEVIGHTSPYLEQHAGNPVDWWPWCDAALTLAREQDKPILLSIGYSACHWCHVMAHESFEDPATAEVMNRLFVNIKVDREERPDLDRIYQTAHQLLAQRPGGWPLTVFLTPDDLRPFFAGTYFPKAPRHGLPAFTELLASIEQAYREQRDAIRTQNDSLMAALASLEPEAAAEVPDTAPLDGARRQLAGSFDAARGGFGSAPKFPHPTNLELLFRHWAATAADGVPDQQALHMARFTLERMIRGGMNDQLAGGFCRYSVDDDWMIPHFEKMLYDNGPLLALCCDAWAITGSRCSAMPPRRRPTGSSTRCSCIGGTGGCWRAAATAART
jgi:uncharacterized protein